jgi:hypothetical protein
MSNSNKFSPTVANEIARTAMYVCSNPECLRLTGFETSEGSPRAIAEAAHISSASASGPPRVGVVNRPGTQIPVDLSSSANGVWLCRNCHKLIDADVAQYPSALLQDWKKSHTVRLRALVGKDLEASLMILGRDRLYHREAHDLLVELEDRRMLFNEMAIEFPSHVQESVFVLRDKIRSLKGRVAFASDSTLTRTLEELAIAIRQFLNRAGRDMHTIIATSGEPRFDKFCLALADFRTAAARAVQPLAIEQKVKADWVAIALED